LICYDISDKNCLGKIGKLMQENTLRIQRSVYFYERVTKKELKMLVQKVLEILDEKADDLRIYTIKDKGISLGSATDLNNPFIFV